MKTDNTTIGTAAARRQAFRGIRRCRVTDEAEGQLAVNSLSWPQAGWFTVPAKPAIDPGWQGAALEGEEQQHS